MIKTITQPAQEWVSAYEPNLFEFKYFNTLGTFTIEAPTVGDRWRFNTGNAALTALFTVGDLVDINSLVEYTVFSIIGNVITFVEKRGPLESAPYSGVVSLIDKELKQLTIFTAHLTAGSNWVELANLYCIYKNGKHSVDVRGYLQDYFRNLQPPPVVGVDKELYINYKIMLGNQQIGVNHSSAYSTIEALGASQYATVGKPLRVGNVEMFNSNKSIYSRINGLLIEDFTI